MRSTIAVFAAALGLASAGLASCATPRTATVPDMPGAKSVFVSGASSAFAAAEPQGQWWRLYADPALDILVQQAFANNRELAEADANLDRVRAVLWESRAAYLPSTTLSGGYTEGKFGGLQMIPGIDRTYAAYNAGFSANYEFDLFGRVRNAVRAARADRDAAVAAVDLVRLTVASETARAYADACAANAQIAVARRTIVLQTRGSELTRTLLDAGRGTGLDTARADSLLAQAQASLSPLRAQRDGALFRLAVLTGQPPAHADSAASSCVSPPQLVQSIPVGDGAGLLARRPDIRQAERQLAAANARNRAAHTARWPTVSLGASATNQALSVEGLKDDAGFAFNVGPMISWSFPNILGANARVGQANASADAAAARLDQTILAALRDTETALTNYANELDRRAALLVARDRAQDALRLSEMRFDQGADSFLSLLDAQRTLASAEAALAQSNAQVTTNQVAVFQALGGGWEKAAG